MSDFNVTSSLCCSIFFFFKQKTAYEMRISDWSSDVRSSDLNGRWRPWKILCCWGKSCARFRDGGAPTQARALDARRGAAHSRSMARAAHAFLLALRDLPHPRLLRVLAQSLAPNTGRASGRERGGQYGESPAVAGELKQ